GAALATGALPTPAAPPAHELAEQVVEDVRHGGSEVGTKAVAAAPLPVERGVAELVVGGTLLRIAQRLVGLVELLELVLGALIAGIAIGMAVLGQAAECRLDVLLACPPGKPQCLVVVALGHQRVFRCRWSSPEVALSPADNKHEPSTHRNPDALSIAG